MTAIDDPREVTPWPFTSYNNELRCQCYREHETPLCHGGMVDYRILTVFTKIRLITECPIHINSGYRCQRHNLEVGGKENSFHLRGLALDLKLPGKMLWGDFVRICQLQNEDGGVLIYPVRKFVHIDRGPKRFLIME